MLKSFRDYFLTFIIALVIFAVVAYFLVGYIINNVLHPTHENNPGIGEETTQTSPDDTGKNPEGTPDIPDEDDESSSFNFLVVGIDYQPDILSDYSKQVIDKLFPGNDYTPAADFNIKEFGLDTPASRRVNAESIMLLQINKEKKQFTYTALPSNMLLTVFGSDTTLGNLYQDYGIQFLAEKVYAITGLAVDYYAVVTIPACEEIVDMFGGVNYNVPCNMEYEDESQNLHISLKAGNQKLSGSQALQLLRFKNYPTNANSRLKTMITFSKAMISKMTNVVYMTKAKEFFDTASKSITTNFTADDLTRNLNLIFAYPNFEILELTYPGSNSYVNGVQCFKPNIEKALSYFKDYRHN